MSRSTGSIAHWPFMAAERQGWFVEQGLRLAVEAEDPPAALQGLTFGKYQVVVVPAGAVAQAPNSTELAIVAGVLNRSISAIVGGREVSRWADLKGKTIAVPRVDDASAGLARRVLEARGLGRADFSLMALLDDEARAAAVQNGTAAAAFVPPPLDGRMVARGYLVLGYANDVVPEFQGDVVVIARAWAREAQNAEAVVRLLRALVRAERWLVSPENRDAAVDLLLSSGISASEARLAHEVVVQRIAAIPEAGAISEKGLRATLDLLGVASGSRSLPPPERLVDGSYLDRARS